MHQCLWFSIITELVHVRNACIIIKPFLKLICIFFFGTGTAAHRQIRQIWIYNLLCELIILTAFPSLMSHYVEM